MWPFTTRNSLQIRLCSTFWRVHLGCHDELLLISISLLNMREWQKFDELLVSRKYWSGTITFYISVNWQSSRTLNKISYPKKFRFLKMVIKDHWLNSFLKHANNPWRTIPGSPIPETIRVQFSVKVKKR